MTPEQATQDGDNHKDESQVQEQELQMQHETPPQPLLISDPPKFLPFNEPISQDHTPPLPHPMQQPVQQLSPKQLTSIIDRPKLINESELAMQPSQQQETINIPNLIQTISEQVSQPVTAQTNDQPQTVVQMDQTNVQPASIPMSFPRSPSKAVVTQTVNLSQEMNLFEWFKTTDIINQIAEKAKHSVDSVITTLDPGMKEYLFSGGNINIVVVTDHDSHISPIRDAFLSVFGRATIGQCFKQIDYPIRVASGYSGALEVAKTRISKLREDASTFPQNQVVLVIQPSLVRLDASDNNSGNQPCNNEWFFTYASILDDPVLGITLHTFSQLVPIDLETIVTLKDDDDSATKHLGFCKSLDEIMNTELKIMPIDKEDMTSWMKVWSGLEDKKIIHDSAISLAHSYQRKWNNNVVK